MSQSGLLDRTRRKQWGEWYVEHLRIMRTVPGIHSAERFETDRHGWSPSLAMYSIASPAVFDDPYYQKIRGMGEWLPLIDRRFYKRNLFDGLEFAPEVPADSVLLVTDQPEPVSGIAGIRFSWLRSIGLDCSTPFRGIAVVPGDRVHALQSVEEIAEYRPVMGAGASPRDKS